MLEDIFKISNLMYLQIATINIKTFYNRHHIEQHLGHAVPEYEYRLPGFTNYFGCDCPVSSEVAGVLIR